MLVIHYSSSSDDSNSLFLSAISCLMSCIISPNRLTSTESSIGLLMLSSLRLALLIELIANLIFKVAFILFDIFDIKTTFMIFDVLFLRSCPLNFKKP